MNQEFVDYGYVKVTRWLQRLGLIINKKKVLRLMRSEGLLLARPKRRGSGKTWVKDLVPQADRPFRYMEVDIKYVRVDGIGRQALLLTVIDVHSRFNLGHLLQYTMQKDDVKELFRHIFATYDMPDGVTVRSDNGSQFESEVVRSYFAEQGTIHEFTKPPLPNRMLTSKRITAFFSVPSVISTCSQAWIMHERRSIDSGTSITSSDCTQASPLELRLKRLPTCRSWFQSL